MTSLTLLYVQRFKDRHGRVRHYYRRPGHARVALPGDPGSEEFMIAYQAAHETKVTAGEGRAKPGSIDALVTAYYQSSDWKELNPLTHRTYRPMLDRFRDTKGKNGARYGDLPARGIRTRHAFAIIDAGKDTPGATRNLIKRLRTLWAFGKARQLVTENPFLDVKLPKEGKGFRAWTDADIAKFEDHWKPGSKERLALALLLYTLVRRSDVVTLGRQHRRQMPVARAGAEVAIDALHFVQKKGNSTVELIIPLHPDLKAVLDQQPKDNLTYLVTEYGRPFTEAGFTKWFGERAQLAGLPEGSTPHGLRKAGSRRLAEAGCTPHELQSVSGHRTLKEVERYTKTVGQAKLARAAIGKLEGH
ncbi:tyrosine-type recombinase/integrase [Caulobacter sp.]|uniref:tyrosine-type recombinase/integrase n=1 Tax=Caulobacter sp. TaxID=78 RepID=UPI003BB0E6F9